MIIPPRRVRRFPAFDTVSGWARIIGVTPYKCKRLMEATGIQPRFYGKIKVVYLSDLRNVNPDLYESMRLRRQLEAEEELDAAV